MIYGEKFNDVFDAIERIEKHIGLLFFQDAVTVNGRLNNIENSNYSQNYVPCCEVDLAITGDSFTTLYDPALIGDAWVVNNSVMITVEQGNDSSKVLHEWGDVEFVGSTGTLVGANEAYSGNMVTLTYFYDQPVLYYDITFVDGYPEVDRIGVSMLDLVIDDVSSELNQRIFIDSKGRVSSYQTTDSTIGNEIYEDLSTGDIYEMYADSGNINWRLI